jgi:hypothetical protein
MMRRMRVYVTNPTGVLSKVALESRTAVGRLPVGMATVGGCARGDPLS